MKKLLLIAALILTLTYSCRKEPEPEPQPPTMAEKARDGLYDLMKVVYLWYDKMPTVKLSDYDGPEDLLEAVRYKPKDKWSFVLGYDDFLAWLQGSFVGHGISMTLDNDRNVRIILIYKGSDLWPLGVRRGWIVKKVNGTDLGPVFYNAVTTGNWTAYDALFGPSAAGITNTLVFQKPDGTEVTFSSTKASFTINSVLASTILDLPGGKTGYLCFNSFIEPSEQELNTAFADFNANNIKDLIIDLRYNRGGDMGIAQQLASLVMKAADTTKVFCKLNYNKLVAADFNETMKFRKTQNPLGLNRVVFITSRESASASEVVINSLTPYIPVSLVGDTTYGKPTGMNIWGFPFPTSSNQNPDYQYVFGPITFEYVNANNEGGFYDGIAPDVRAIDDITRDFGDPEEASLKAAIAVLEGSKAKSDVLFRPHLIRDEGDQLPKDLFILPVK